MTVENYLREQGLSQVFEEMRKLREQENNKTKEEIIEEYGGGGSGQGPDSPEVPNEAIDDNDIDGLFDQE